MSHYNPIWRLLLCDWDGNVLVNISAIARNKQFGFNLMQPATLSFTLPANNEYLNALHTDGHPMLDVGRRVVKAYRREPQEDGTFEYILRYFGIVHSIDDEGSGEHVRSTVSCVDPSANLAKWICREFQFQLDAGDPLGSGFSYNPVYNNYVFNVGAAAQLGANVTLPAGTITVASTSGFASQGQFQIAGDPSAIVSYTGRTETTFTGCTGGTGSFITGEAVVQGPQTPEFISHLVSWSWPRGVQYNDVDYGPTHYVDSNPYPFRAMKFEFKKLGDAITDLANTYPPVEYWFEPIEDGVFLNVYNQMGDLKPEAIFAYGMAPHNCVSAKRTTTAADLANHIVVLGSEVNGKVPVTYNYVPNGGFTTNTTGWAGVIGTETLTRTTGTYMGSPASLSVVTNGAVAGQGAQTNAFAVVPNKPYEVTLGIKGNGSTQFYFRVEELDASNTVVKTNTYTSYPVLPGSGNFSTYSLWPQATLTTVKMRISVVTKTASALTFYIDNVQAAITEEGADYVDTDGAPALGNYRNYGKRVYNAWGMTDPDFGPLDDISQYSDVKSDALLEAVGEQEIALRDVPREEVSLTPMRGKHPLPWDEFFIGDYINVRVGPQMRGGFTGYQRVVGFTLEVGDDSGEAITSLVVRNI